MQHEKDPLIFIPTGYCSCVQVAQLVLKMRYIEEPVYPC